MNRCLFLYLKGYPLWILILLSSSCSSFNQSLATGIGHAASLDGDEDYIHVENSHTLVMTDTLTIEVWIYPVGSGIGREGIIVCNIGQYQLARYDDGSIRFAISNASC